MNVTDAQSIVKQFRTDIRSADNLAKRARIIAVRATSRHIKLARQLATVSISDIVESYGCTELMQDPEFRVKMRELSAKLNS